QKPPAHGAHVEGQQREPDDGRQQPVIGVEERILQALQIDAAHGEEEERDADSDSEQQLPRTPLHALLPGRVAASSPSFSSTLGRNSAASCARRRTSWMSAVSLTA